MNIPVRIATHLIEIECETCSGTGRICDTFRYVGEAYGGWLERPCEDCEGTGYFEVREQDDEE